MGVVDDVESTKIGGGFCAVHFPLRGATMLDPYWTAVCSPDHFEKDE